MAGIFELFLDSESRFRFRLKGPDGTVIAVSRGLDEKSAAVAGITAVREYAGMGLISDLCPNAGGSQTGRREEARVEPVPSDQRGIPGGEDGQKQAVQIPAVQKTPLAPMQSPPVPAI